ncbi:hypothetical protein ACIRCZ_18955 [Leifsonia sp. NPDC102414]|uniref:hypothetical protein n=1 Tax=Leifsonia sp. NPDC102414 TaxID=3364124 RepID=UPI00382537D0
MSTTIQDPFNDDAYVIEVTFDGYVYRFPSGFPEEERQMGIGFPAFRIGYVDSFDGQWQATTWTGSIVIGDGGIEGAVKALVAAEHSRRAASMAPGDGSW